MTTKEYDITEMVPLNSVVRQAILDVYGDYVNEEARFTAWAVRAFKELSGQRLRGSNKRYAILNVNKNTNHALLPPDFKEEFGVYILNKCNEKVYLDINPNIANIKAIEEIPCDHECGKGCECYPKQMCEDLVTTQVVNKIRIGDTDYDETITSTLQPNGEYYVVTTTPYLNLAGGNGVEYKTTKDYVTTFDVEDCGCIKKTPRNTCKLEMLCPDLFACYCAPCCSTRVTDFGGYQIFPGTNTIQFDRAMTFDKVYMEYRGCLPKSGNEYLVPEIAFETVIELTKYMSVKNKKGVNRTTVNDWFNNYLTQRGNMEKKMGRVSLSSIMSAVFTLPSFSYTYKSCDVSSPCSDNNTIRTSGVSSSSSSVIVVPPANLPSSGCNPAIITTNGAEMGGGVTYSNGLLQGVPFRVYANAFNRFMFEGTEYTVLPSGGFTVLTGVYGINDQFDIFPKWCDANTSEMPDQVILGAKKLVIKVDGIAGSPVAGQTTYQNNVLIGATVEDIIVNKTIETVVDGDFTFDPVTGTIDRAPNIWTALETSIINYIK